MSFQDIEIQMKKLCLERMTYAILYAVAMQYLLLIIFLLFINFSVFHPIVWITSSISVLFSFYTWLWTTPLISSIMIFGVLLSKFYLSGPEYYTSRFHMLKNTFMRRMGFLTLHFFVGFLTAWLYTNFLSDEYKYIGYQCGGETATGKLNCLNEKFVFLIVSGIYGGLLFFFRETRRDDSTLKFAVVQLPKYVQIRSHFYHVFYQSMIKMIVPVIGYVVGYTILRSVIKTPISSILNLNDDQAAFSTVVFDLKLLFFIWILLSQITSNMISMKILFNIFLTEHHLFPIEKEKLIERTEEVVTLSEALSITKPKLSLILSSLDLYRLSDSREMSRRQQIYALSIPGGHPYNWKNLVTKCLEIIAEFNTQLSSSLLKNSCASTTNNNQLGGALRPSASDMAEKLLLRQYNEAYGIRNILAQNGYVDHQPNHIPDGKMSSDLKINQFIDAVNKKVALFKNYLINLPGIYYLFTETEQSKSSYLLSQSQPIMWLAEGISNLAVHSINEDRYGVVQDNLTEIIEKLIALKKTVDAITPLDLGGKKIDRNYVALKNSLKRSLYRICTEFGDYINELPVDHDHLKVLKNYVLFRDP